MAIITTHVNDSDTARTGTIVFASEGSAVLAIEPCWLPSQDAGFVRFKLQRGTYSVESVFDYQDFEDMVAKAIEKRKTLPATE